jgi:N-acetylglucosaminyl-diphospho-decaprenol L-rhamnosyltransferase
MAGIVVVTYNSADLIGRCLDACLRIEGADVVVIDNASTDGTIAEVDRRNSVRLIGNTTNKGFAAAVNQGFQELQTETVLILNPDTVVAGGIDELERAILSDDRVGAATGLLLDESGKVQHGFNVRGLPTAATLVFELLGINRLFPFNPVNRRYRVRMDPFTAAEVEQPAGAFLMVRRSAWEAVGGFDEGFHPVWFEDVDFCKRLHDYGFRILYVPTASAEHKGGQSVTQMGWIVRQRVWYGSLLRYASKHYGVFARRGIAAAVIVGCVVRAIGRSATELSVEPFTACSRVVRLASLYLRKGDRGGVSTAACSATKESKSRF